MTPPLRPPPTAPVLALDTASPLVSVAVADRGGVAAERSVEISRSSRRLLEMIDEVLREADLRLPQLGGIVALRGPGSFTGIRVGLATVLGFHEALGIPATAFSQHEALAAAGPPDLPPGAPLLAAVDVLRDEWAVEPFAAGDPPRSTGSVERLPAAEVARCAPAALVGFGVRRFADRTSPGTVLFEPGPLAPSAALRAARHPAEWTVEHLVHPLYLRPPAVTLPSRPTGR